MLLHGTEMTMVDPEWSVFAAGAGLDRYEAIIERAEKPFSETSTTRVYHLQPDPERWPGGVYLKKFFYRSWSRFIFRPAKPSIEHRNYRFLETLNLNVPKVLAIGERRRFGGLVDAFILTAGIENAPSMEDFFKREDSASNEEHVTEILDQLANIVATMHEAKFFHIDLQWRNILIQRNDPGAESAFRVFLIDCPRGGRRWFFARSWNGRMHDLAGLEKLAGLYLSPKERLKWFKQYAGVKKLGWQDRLLIRWIVREIESRRRPATE